MHLINTETLELEEFVGTLPRYAILSHTWGHEEISFQQMQERRQDRILFLSHYEGFRKIRELCDLARWDCQSFLGSYRYVWIDTCCIDKASSAELQEAINSMWHWYREAGVCYAYLDDVETAPKTNAYGIILKDDESATQFKESRWFTRGWTLQELIAPREVVFFKSDWVRIGLRSDNSSLIEQITGVRECFIRLGAWTDQSKLLADTAAAEKMSWAARRVTTRIEDQAYCMLGLFNVNMPMLYGEREKAFKRLQEEIIRSTNDSSILAWGLATASYDGDYGESVLAPSPDAFSECGSLVRCDPTGNEDTRPALFSRVQIGLLLELPAITLPKRPSGTDVVHYAILNCGPRSWDGSKRGGSDWDGKHVVAIPLSSRTDDGNVFFKGYHSPTLLSSEFVHGAVRSDFYMRPSSAPNLTNQDGISRNEPKMRIEGKLSDSAECKFFHPPEAVVELLRTDTATQATEFLAVDPISDALPFLAVDDWQTLFSNDPAVEDNGEKQDGGNTQLKPQKKGRSCFGISLSIHPDSDAKKMTIDGVKHLAIMNVVMGNKDVWIRIAGSEDGGLWQVVVEEHLYNRRQVLYSDRARDIIKGRARGRPVKYRICEDMDQIAKAKTQAQSVNKQPITPFLRISIGNSIDLDVYFRRTE